MQILIGVADLILYEPWADFRVLILPDQLQRAAEQFLRPQSGFPVNGAGAFEEITQRCLINHVEMIGELLQCLFAKANGFVVSAFLPQAFDLRRHLLHRAVFQLIAQQGIHRHIKKVRQRNDHAQLRGGRRRFPLGNRSNGDPQRLCQLLLCHVFPFAIPADVFCQFQFHV